jgi:S-formylglutathione hydrolase FrmB
MHFADLLRQRHIAYEAIEFPGEHEWTFWEAAIPQMLRSLARACRTWRVWTCDRFSMPAALPVFHL